MFRPNIITSINSKIRIIILTATERRLNAQLAVKYAALELEMDEMLAGLKLFRDSLNLKAESSVNRISSLEAAAAS